MKEHKSLKLKAQVEKTSIESPLIENASETIMESQLFSPRHRPSYPRLVIIDDGKVTEGEEIRVRCDCLTIGRSGCDLSFPAEGMMSAKHARVFLKQVGQQTWAWVLEDLDSKNGLFIRLSEFSLKNGNEFLMGGVRYLFHDGAPGGAPTIESNPSITSYVAPAPSKGHSDKTRTACLECFEYSVPECSRFIPLSRGLIPLGRLVEGDGKISSDPFLEPLHAKLIMQKPRSWLLVDQNSTNGIWLRIKEAVLLKSSSFLAGEQRFEFVPH